MVKKYWLIIFILSISVLRNGSVFAKIISISHNTLSAAYHNWQEVDIVYDHDFPYKEVYDNQKITKCVKAYRTVNDNHAESMKYTAIKKNIPVLRCREYIRLLRSIKTINQWRHIQSEKHFFPLTIREFNIINIPAHITAVHASPKDVGHSFSCLHKTGRVMGTFERHEVDIRTYTFKSITTGKTIRIHATPGHPVYVKDKALFIPIDLLSSTDELLNNTGQRIRLICSAGHTEHCGISLNNMTPTPVYNLEIDKNHTYFVSKIKLLVHNNCQLAEKLKQKLPDLVVANKYGYPFLRIGSYNDLNLAYSTLITLYGAQVQSDTLAFLAVSHLQNSPVSIEAMEVFFKKKSILPGNEYEYEQVLNTLLGVIDKKDIKGLNEKAAMLLTADSRPVVVVTAKKAHVLMHPKILENYTLHEFISGKIQPMPLPQKFSAVEKFDFIFNDSLYGKPLSYYILMTKKEREYVNIKHGEGCRELAWLK